MNNPIAIWRGINGKIHRGCFRLLLTAVLISVPSGLAIAQGNSPKITRAQAIKTGGTIKIVNGIITYGEPTVGALLYVSGQIKFGSWCTGTIIGCNTFLTAAHCISGDENPTNYRVFLQHGGLFEVKSIAWRKQQFVEPNSSTGANADIAVLQLAKSVNGIHPHPINEEGEHAVGRKGTIVGFGRTGGQKYDYGLKRIGLVIAAACQPSFVKSELVCWNFKGQQFSNTCNGDSGGPLFLSEGRPVEVISGVTSGGINPACLPEDHSFDTSVFRHRQWIRSIAGNDLEQATCGPLKPLEDDAQRYSGFGGQITKDYPEHVFEFDIEGARELRVGANLGKPADVDAAELVTIPELYVIKGKNQDLAQAACTSKQEGQAVFCAVENPSDGTYTVVLRRGAADKVADFQLVASVF